MFFQLPDSLPPLTTPSAQALDATRTTGEALAYLASLVGVDWAGMPEPQRSRYLRDCFTRSTLPPETREALWEWALRVTDPMIDAFDFGTDEEERLRGKQAAWGHPMLIPAMLALAPYPVPTGRPISKEGRERRASQSWHMLISSPLELAYRSWDTFGLVDGADLAAQLRTWAPTTSETTYGWLLVAAHPSVSLEAQDRALRFASKNPVDWREGWKVLTKPGMLKAPRARQMLWGTDLTQDPLTPELVRETPVKEYGELVALMAREQRYGCLGELLHFASDAQLCGVKATEHEVTTWLRTVPTRRRTAVMRLVPLLGSRRPGARTTRKPR